VEFFKSANIDFLGKKWYFIAFSLIFSVAGVLSMVFWHGIPLDIDFRGGTQVSVKFSHAPDVNAVHQTMDRIGYHNARIRTFGGAGSNDLLIDLPQQETGAHALDQGKQQIINALHGNAPADKQDLNNASSLAISAYLLQTDPLHLSTDAQKQYAAIAQKIADYRDKTRGGVLASLDDLKGVVDPVVQAAVQQGFYLSDFGVYNVAIVGPQVGAQLRKQAMLATAYSLAGMLVYLAFRFELIYGVAAVITVFHDTLITVGAFSLTDKPISLTVIAAILTLIGYSNNVNRSINQTLSRTILTAGLTFLTVLALFLFGGEVLHGFSFALVIGILIGTYSSIAIAAPILVAYQDWRQNRSKPIVALAGKGKGR